jgi:nitrite reductase/ring-hydroxylating ferredoxin subunit
VEENLKLCTVDDIEDGGSAALIGVVDDKRQSLIGVRRDGAIHVYVNRCPHIGAPLNLDIGNSPPGRFLTRDRQHILCVNHGARFNFEDGLCVAGPCVKQHLQAVAIKIEDGMVHLTS